MTIDTLTIEPSVADVHADDDAPSGMAFHAVPTLDRTILSTIRVLFDRTYYLERHADVAKSGIDPLDHFLTAGLAEGRSPCALFDADFYASQTGTPQDRDNLFLHYLTVGIAAALDPHPLIDHVFYTRHVPALPPGSNPLSHILGAGRRENRPPNPLFDPAYYRRRHGLSDRSINPLVHYATIGCRQSLSPHPLFDSTAYLSQRPDVAGAGVDPLAHYLHGGMHEDADPCPSFDSAYYTATCKDAVEPGMALLHFATHGGDAGGLPNRMFDADFYRRRYPDVQESGLDPFLHFLEIGLPENRDPHPMFDASFYAEANPDVTEVGIAPFVHYVRYGAKEGRDPNPLLPIEAYVASHPAAASFDGGPVAHFLANRKAAYQRLCDGFDPGFYAAASMSGSADAEMSPLLHYLSIGRLAGAAPLPRSIATLGWQSSEGQTDDPLADSTHILFCVQDASPGDAGLLALRGLQQLAADPALSCRVLIGRDGPLADSFALLAPTLWLGSEVSRQAERPEATLTEILHAFRAEDGRGVVLVNGVGMPDLAAICERLDLTLLVWALEAPVAIDSLLGGDATMQPLARIAARILTNSEASRRALMRRYDLQPERCTVLSSGIAPLDVDLDPRVLSLALRDRFGLPPDALVVMGRGEIDFRNGVDLFIRVGHRVITRGRLDTMKESALRQAYFLWIGPERDRLFAALCRDDVERLGLAQHIRLIDIEDESRMLLMGSDLLLDTARDATSVIARQEAEASGVPVIGFGDRANTTRGGGLVEVDYLDTEALEQAVLLRGNRPARRTRASLSRARQTPSWTGWHQQVTTVLEECRQARA